LKIDALRREHRRASRCANRSGKQEKSCSHRPGLSIGPGSVIAQALSAKAELRASGSSRAA